MAEATQVENKTEEVNLADLLNRRREQQINQEFQDKLNDIRFRPLAVKAEKHQSKIDKQKKKSAKLTDKINKVEKKINKWKAKIADAEKTKAYCEQLLSTHSLPKPLQMFFQSMLDKQNKKIERCQEKIGQGQEKIKKFTSRRTKCQKKIAKRQEKIDKIARIDKFITNIGTSQGRRENFVQLLTEMRKTSLEKKSKKALRIDNKIAQKELALSKATTEAEKVRIQQQIDKLKEQKDKLTGKIERLESMAEKLNAFSVMLESDADKVIDAATEGAKTAFAFDADDKYDPDDVFIVEADKAFGNQKIEHELSDADKAVIAQLKNEVIIDRLYFGEVTAVTLEHIQQAGFEFDGNSTFTKIESAQEETQENIKMYYQPDKTETPESEPSSEQKSEPQAEQKAEPEQTEHELAAETIDNYFDYNLNAKINEQMKKAVLDSKGTDHTDHMQYDEINRAQAEYLFSVKKKAGLEFAVFDAIPNTKNKVKKEVKGVYTLAYRDSYGKRIKDALLEFENKLEQQSEQNPVQEPTQKGSSQAADAGKQSDLVKFSGLSGTHIQALKESNIHFWVKREPDNTFSAYFHRPDVEQAKGVLSSVSQAQKKTASQSRQQQTKPKR